MERKGKRSAESSVLNALPEEFYLKNVLLHLQIDQSYRWRIYLFHFKKIPICYVSRIRNECIRTDAALTLTSGNQTQNLFYKGNYNATCQCDKAIGPLAGVMGFQGKF